MALYTAWHDSHAHGTHPAPPHHHGITAMHNTQGQPLVATTVITCMDVVKQAIDEVCGGVVV